jgi:hypothetical protein
MKHTVSDLRKKGALLRQLCCGFLAHARRPACIGDVLLQAYRVAIQTLCKLGHCTIVLETSRLAFLACPQCCTQAQLCTALSVASMQTRTSCPAGHIMTAMMDTIILVSAAFNALCTAPAPALLELLLDCGKLRHGLLH